MKTCYMKILIIAGPQGPQGRAQFICVIGRPSSQVSRPPITPDGRRR
jgi:hypothetical protein